MSVKKRKLACQEHLIPGANLVEKWHTIEALGYAGIELLGHGDFALEKRLPELREAKREGVVFSTSCVIMDHFIGDFDKEKRRNAIDNMKSQLSVMAELEGVGAITPASYGMFSRVLPPFEPPRSSEDDSIVLCDALSILGEHAQREGLVLLLEPLNRYEDHMLNTLQQGVRLCEQVGLASVKLLADVFHMSIEEKDSAAALIAAKDYVHHIHLADSNRLEPGQGHTDFSAIVKALDTMGYEGFMALECRFNQPAEHALRASAEILS